MYTPDWAAQVQVAAPVAGENQAGGSFIVDSSGNTYVAFTEDGNIEVQKINAAGVWQWTNTGVVALNVANALTSPTIVDVGGGYIVVSGYDATAGALYAQKINSAGSLQWGGATPLGGVTVLGAGVATPPKAVYDNANGVYYAFLSAVAVNNKVQGVRISTTDGAKTTGAAAKDMVTCTVATASLCTVTAAAPPGAYDPDLLAVVAGSNALIVIAAENGDNDLDEADDAYIHARFMDPAGTVSADVILHSDGTLGAAITDIRATTDGANGAMVVASWRTAAAVADAIGINGVKSNGATWNGTALLTAYIAQAANVALYDAAFVEEGSVDYVAVAYTDATDTILQKKKIGSLATTYFPAKWATGFNIATGALEVNTRIADAGSGQVAYSYVDVATGNDVHASIVKNNATGTAGALVFADTTIDSNSGGTLTEAGIKAIAGTSYCVWLDDTSDDSYQAIKFHNETKIDIVDGTQPLIIVSPDPAILSFDTGGAVQVKDQWKNLGDLDASSIVVNYYLAASADGTWGNITTKLLLGSRTISSLEAAKEESSAVTTDLTIPANNSVGSANTYIFAIANESAYSTEAVTDSDGDGAAGNTALDNSQSKSISITNANLIPFAGAFTILTTGSADMGAAIQVQDKNQNTGSVDAGEFVVKYYLVSNAKADPNNNGNLADSVIGVNTLASYGTLIGSRTVTSLAAGAIETATVDLTLPATFNFEANAQPWIYKFIDGDKVVSETVEIDNVDNTPNSGCVRMAAKFLNVANLEMTAVTVDKAVANPLDNIVVTDVVTNNGQKAAENLTVKYYLVTNNLAIGNLVTAMTVNGGAVNVATQAQLEANGSYLGERTIASLNYIAGSNTDTATTTLTLPSKATNASYVIAIVDPENAVLEINELDNIDADNAAAGPTYGQITGASGAIAVSGKADLIVQAVATDKLQVYTGEFLTLTFSISNQGGANAAASVAYFYLSADETYDATDVFLGSQVVRDLPIAGPTTVTYTGNDAPIVMIPASISDGTYYLIIVADATEMVTEIDETNNSKASAAITVGEVAVLTATPTSVSIASAGGTADVAIGGGATPYSIVTQPDAGVATATLVDATLTVTAVADGSTSVVVKDNSSPAQTVTIPVTVNIGGAQNPPTETNVGLCDAACQASAPVTATGVDFSYTEGVTILVGAMDATFTQVWWLNSSCEYTTDYAEAASGETALSCSVDAPDDAAWLFWFVTAEDLDTLNWDTGAYELLFYSLD
ncbi:MAG: hypothetical protein J7J98_00780 [candidate division Zixibacteria bacterium]|nr:hypothetical protein [candidate division Zixibacteria bacterium]